MMTDSTVGVSGKNFGPGEGGMQFGAEEGGQDGGQRQRRDLKQFYSTVLNKEN